MRAILVFQIVFAISSSKESLFYTRPPRVFNACHFTRLVVVAYAGFQMEEEPTYWPSNLILHGKYISSILYLIS